MRVHVIGGPGTGKTTVATALARELGCRLVDLDRVVAYEPPSDEPSAPFGLWERVSSNRRLEAARTLAFEPAWVSEGVYAGWTEPLVAAADTILWLDLRGWQAASGVLRRQWVRARSAHGDRYGWGDTLRLARRAGFGFRFGAQASEGQLTERDSANSAATTAKFLAPHESRVVRCRTRASMRRAVELILAEGRPMPDP